MKNLPWTRILAVLLVGVIAFSWWQYRELSNLQYRVGTDMAEKYRELGYHVREMRCSVGSALVTAENDRAPLEQYRFRPRGATAWQAIRELNLVPHGRVDTYPLYHFFDSVESGLRTIARGKGPLEREEFAYLEKIHPRLVELEEIFFRDQEFMWGDSRKVAQSFYRGRNWPQVLEEMVAVLGEDVGEIYRAYRYSPPRPESEQGSLREPDIPGEPVTQEQAKAAAREFLSLEPEEYQWELSGEGYNSYYGDNWTFRAVPADGDGQKDVWEVEVLTTGAHIIRAYRRPSVFPSPHRRQQELVPAQVTEAEAVRQAKDLAAQWGMEDMEPAFAPVYEHSRHYYEGKGAYGVDLVRRKGDIFWNDYRLEVEVCGESGEILSWDRTAIIMAEEREIPQPALTRDAARAVVAGGQYPVQDGPLVYRGDSDNLVCYFRVEIDGAQYDVWIDAMTGYEEWVGPAGGKFWIE